MSAHDRAAAREARRFTLTVCKSDAHCSQHWDIPNLTQAEVDAEKALALQMYKGFTVGFDIEAC